jgi:hypothetical protein
MNTLKLICGTVGSLTVLFTNVVGQTTEFHDLNVGIGAAPSLREINWASRGELFSGSWGVGSESFLGFTLTALLDGTPDGANLSYESASNRTLGVASVLGVGRLLNRTNEPIGREALRLELPAQGAAGVVAGDAQATFAGLSQMAFDRLSQGTGNIVVISGFVADPQASWAAVPGNEASLVYSNGTLRFEVGRGADGWTPVGVVAFANLNATLSDAGVVPEISNDRENNANSFGLFAWQYAATASGQSTPDPLVFAGVSQSDVVDGFVTLPGLGLVNLIHYPWIYHATHGWLFSAMATWADGGWFFDANQQGWWASSAAAYPWYYVSGSGWTAPSP